VRNLKGAKVATATTVSDLRDTDQAGEPIGSSPTTPANLHQAERAARSLPTVEGSR
jgi:hypothetical protein